jgi:AraC-like DNA-binding protein
MKIEYEKISPDSGSSFRLIHWKSENDKFFWHYHPEYEIVYVRKGTGRRSIGSDLANYEEGELVFMGPNLPHTGFGYGVIGEHEEIVVQLKENFLGEMFLQAPEMDAVKKLFERSKRGISFHGKVRKIVGNKLQKMLQMPYFERLIELLTIFQLLATTHEFVLLHADGTRFDFSHKDEDRINKIYTYVEKNHKKPIDIQEVADMANLTVPSFCRYFKKMTHLTFTDFVNEFRINQACKLLLNGEQISDICFEIGFNNVSHFNKTFKQLTGKSPREYKKNIEKT